MMCLLCSATIAQEISFTELLFLKKQERHLCQTCQASFQEIQEKHCPTCYKEGEEESCQDCQFWCKEGVKVNHKALFAYNQAMKDYFSRYKFEGDYVLGRIFSNVLRQALKEYKGYQLVPVPLSNERFQKRGFNQVEGLLQEMGIAYQDLLEKKEVKASSSKTRQERLETQSPFSIKKERQIPKKILLFDDIYTTGATLNRIKQLLEMAGCQDVKTFSLAR